MAHNDSAVCTRICNKSLDFCVTILWRFLTYFYTRVGSLSLISKLLALSKYWYWCFIFSSAAETPATLGHNSLWHQILCDKKFNIVANCWDKGRRNRHNFLAEVSLLSLSACWGRCADVSGWCDGHKTKRDNSWHLFCVMETLVFSCCCNIHHCNLLIGRAENTFQTDILQFDELKALCRVSPALAGSDFNPALARGGCATVDFNSVKTVQFFHWLN